MSVSKFLAFTISEIMNNVSSIEVDKIALKIEKPHLIKARNCGDCFRLICIRNKN